MKFIFTHWMHKRFLTDEVPRLQIRNSNLWTTHIVTIGSSSNADFAIFAFDFSMSARPSSVTKVRSAKTLKASNVILTQLKVNYCGVT